MSVNRYHVPKRQWAKWSPLRRHVFTATYQYLRQQALAHVSPVMAWNGAWMAGAAAEEYDQGDQ